MAKTDKPNVLVMETIDDETTGAAKDVIKRQHAASTIDQAMEKMHSVGGGGLH